MSRCRRDGHPHRRTRNLYSTRQAVTAEMSKSASSLWSPRETELLVVALRLLQENGYERLTLDAVATEARASKATVYRRWPSKAELVLAAFIEGIGGVAGAPDTGTLRGDLLQVGKVLCEQARQHASTIRAVLVEISRNPALKDALRHQVVDQRHGVIRHIVQQAVDRGEVDAAAIDNELSDLLPGYLIFRSVLTDRPPTRRTVQALVDKIMIPTLTRPAR
jgi:AcrR family transcriptional regulator